MSALLLIIGGLVLSSFMFGGNQENLSEDSSRDSDDFDADDSPEETMPDFDSEETSPPDPTTDDENDDGLEPPYLPGGCDDEACDARIFVDDNNNMVVLMPEVGESSIELDRSNDGIHEVRVRSDHNLIRVSWSSGEDASNLILESGEGSVSINFLGEANVPFSDIYFDSNENSSGLTHMSLSDIAASDQTNTIIFGRFETGSEDTDRPEEVIGTNGNDAIVLVNDQDARVISYERGVFLGEVDTAVVVSANSGDDTLSLENGNFIVFGGDGLDQITYSASGGVGFGGSGNDTLSSAGSAVALLGDEGDDVIEGSSLGDTLVGGPGFDQVLGSSGDDLVIGHGLWLTDSGQRTAVVDDIVSQSSDTMYGGTGNDTIVATSGDLIFGGAGDDNILIYFQPNSEPAFFEDFSDTDSLLIEVILDEPFDEAIESSKVDFIATENSVEVIYDGSVLVVLPKGSEELSARITVRFTQVDEDGNYLG